MSSDKTSAERLSDFRIARREKDKKRYPKVGPRWTASLNSYILCRMTLQVAFAGLRVLFSFLLSMRTGNLQACCTAVLLATFAVAPGFAADPAPHSLELSRAVRTWEFLPIVGQRAALFGNEAGRMEAWVYPLKIFRDFHLTFHVDGRAIPAENLVRTVIVHPESATLVYAGDDFSVRETFFVPVREPAALIQFEIETEQPIEIEASFLGDFQLEWPAALGGTYLSWNESKHSFVFGEEQKKFAAIVGSPSAASPMLAYQTNFSSSDENSLRLGVVGKGTATKTIFIAASTQGLSDAEATYQRIASSWPELLRDSFQFYRDYLDRTVHLTLPDQQLQEAYDWSRISTIQGLVTNPYLGTGLVAGYRTSGLSQRPGFAWYFGRDSEWSSFALNSIGDFSTTRTALDFISKFQRDDGKIPHEISQAAGFVDWFKGYPYAFASADATPLYIIAADDYVMRSGDADFARQRWDKLWKAYQFLRSTYDEQNIPRNFSIGHGWVEGGPLLPVKSEFYQSGLGLQALRSLARLAKIGGKEDVSKELQAAYDRQRPAFNQAFWSAEQKSFQYALDQQNRLANESSVLTTVPMWFGVTDDDKSELTIQRLADSDHQTDWGMRIISNRSPVYNGSGYHYGSVWPLFTGWAAVGEYRYHQPLVAYTNLRANALLALDGSLGHVAEVLSGDYYQPLSTNSPHQIWSAAMVVSPILRGMLGLETDAIHHTVRFAPHVPADWSSLSVDKLAIDKVNLTLTYQRSPGLITVEVERSGTRECTLDLSPAMSLRSAVSSVEINGHPAKFKVDAGTSDQHVSLAVPLTETSMSVRIRLKNDFEIGISNALPALGSRSEGLRVLSQLWNAARTQMTVSLAGLAGKTYTLPVRGVSQIKAARGAKVLRDASGDTGAIVVTIPSQNPRAYLHHDVLLEFGTR